jgi:hypothetical protein
VTLILLKKNVSTSIALAFSLSISAVGAAHASNGFTFGIKGDYFVLVKSALMDQRPLLFSLLFHPEKQLLIVGLDDSSW